MNEYGLANNFASGYSGANTSLQQYENLLASKPVVTGVPSTVDFRVAGQVPALGQDFKLGDAAMENALGFGSGSAQVVDPKAGTGTLFGMDNATWDSAMKAGQIGTSVGNLGLGLASYFQNKGLADKQKKLLGQQIANNDIEMGARKDYRNALEKF